MKATGSGYPLAAETEPVEIHIITNWLRRSDPFWMTLYTSVTAFSLYTCIYAFRKAFPAATFEGIFFFGVSYKVWLVVFQAAGYGLSKFIGISFISELKKNNRRKGIIILSFIAVLSWLLFGLVPPPFNVVFLFTNGLPLGMIWGIIFSYLEGRKVTEVLGAALSISFIFSSGLARSVGSYLITTSNVSELWMPLVASVLFAGPLLLFAWLLDKVPAPSAEDEWLRTPRRPMSKAERKQFISTFLPGIVFFVLAYVMLTTFRDFRDNFSAEVWKSINAGHAASVFTETEIPVSIIVLVVVAGVMFIRNNQVALMINHAIILAGMLLIGLGTLLFEYELINATIWMTIIGLGLYLGYVPFNSIFFERLLAAFRYAGTVGFVMYISDAFGYLGSLGVLFFKEFGYRQVSWLQVFINSGYFISIAGFVLMLLSMFYFNQRHSSWRKLSEGN